MASLGSYSRPVSILLAFGGCFLGAAILFAGCGKYGSPLPPELLAPAEVQALEVNAQLEGVTFRWRSPEKDIRGEKLKQIDGYRVYRKELSEANDLANPEVEYVLIGTLGDRHLAEKQRLEREAIAAGRLTRRVKIDEGLTRFEFSDREVKPGQSYVYRIVPFNQGETEGAALQLIKILFRGDTSQVQQLNAESPEFDLDADAFE